MGFVSRIYVPANKSINPDNSITVSLSPIRIKANTATNPGVRAINGRALLISRFLIESITHKKARAPKTDFIKRINRLTVERFW